jgi:molecular chaperone DnaK (HSP70)
MLPHASLTSVAEHVTCDDGWPASFGADDVYCRSCGKRLLADRFVPAELTFVVNSDGGTPAQTVSIDNGSSLRALRLTPLFTDPALKLDVDADGVIEVPAGGRRDVRVWIEGDPLAGDDDGTLTLAFTVGHTADTRVLPIRVGRTPSFEFELTPFGRIKANAIATRTATLRQTGGLATRITRVSLDHAAFSQTGLHVGQSFEAGTAVPFEVSCDAALLQPGHTQAVLTVEGTGPCAASAPVLVEVVKGAALSVTLLGNVPEVPQGLISELTLSVRNDGGTEVDVTALKAGGQPWFRLDRVDLPFRVAPGAVRKIRCLVDAAGLALGTHAVDAEATPSEGNTVTRRLQVRVVPLEAYEYFVAIDFGTTNSCVAYYGSDGVQMVMFRRPDGTLTDVVPSAAYFEEATRRWLVGFEAQALMKGNPESGVRSVKRLLNPDGFVSKKGMPVVEIGERSFAPEAVAAEVFRFLKQRTEQELQKSIDQVMITVPANFTDTGIRAVIAAAREAGLKPFQVDRQKDWHTFRINEPTAAALDASSKEVDNRQAQRYLLIFDFGGGTLDVSILLITTTPGVRQVRVLANKGANWLGGDNFTEAMIGLIVRAFEATHGIGRLRHDIGALKASRAWKSLDDIERLEAFRNRQNLWEAAEQAKIALSDSPGVEGVTVDVTVELSIDGSRQGFATTITRDAFEQAVESLVASALKCVNRAVKSAQRELPGFELNAIDEVIATGSASLVPLVRRRLKEHIGRELWSPHEQFSEKACVARGACQYGAYNISAIAVEGEARLEVVGIHDQTNCSYGTGVRANSLIGRPVYREIIAEGEKFHAEDAQGKSRLFTSDGMKVSPAGNVKVTIYQHTGDVSEQAETPIENNPDIVPVVRIDVQGVAVPDRSNPPRLKVHMWLADDGLLDAEATVEGHLTPFRPDFGHRSAD